MTLQQKDIYGWKGYVWESGDISVGIVPQLGGRIMSLKFRGEELFFVQPEHAGETFDLSRLSVDKKEFGFRVWGGDKTWVAPEKMWVDKIPPLDLDAGKYTLTSSVWGRKLTMSSPICRETGLRIIREVSFKNKYTLVLVETIKNETKKPIQRGIWNVAQVVRPFEVYVPCAFNTVRLYPDEAYKHCNPHYYLIDAGNFTGVSCRDQVHFKFGAYLDKGQMVVIKRYDHAIIGLRKTFSVIPNATYAHDAHVEFYNSPSYPYGEIEIHAPEVILNSGQSFSHMQEWALCAFSPDTALDRILESNAFSQF